MKDADIFPGHALASAAGRDDAKIFGRHMGNKKVGRLQLVGGRRKLSAGSIQLAAGRKWQMGKFIGPAEPAYSEVRHTRNPALRP